MNWLERFSIRIKNYSTWNRNRRRPWRSTGRRAQSGPCLTESLEARQLLSGAPVAVGPETQVNTFTTGEQQNPSIAADAAGDYVVVWTSYNQASSTSGSDIYAQRYNSARALLRVVNFWSMSTQPTIKFIRRWRWINRGILSSPGKATTKSRLEASMTFMLESTIPQASLKVLSSRSTPTQQANRKTPSVAMDSGGDFVIAWSSYNHYGGRGLYAIYAQRYNSTGVAQGNKLRGQSISPLCGRKSFDRDGSIGRFRGGLVGWLA